MNLIQDLKNNLGSIFGGKVSETVAPKSKAPVLNQRMGMLNLPEPPDMMTGDYLEAMRGWVYIAVKAISQEVAKIDLILYRKKAGKVEIVPEHEMIDVLNDINPFSNKYEFFEAVQSYLELCGEIFVYKSKVNGHTKQLYLLRPDWVDVLPPTDKAQVIGGYRYTVSGKKTDYLPEDIIPFKYFNPTNPYRGMGALQAATYAYDVDLYSTKWNRNFFYNNAMPDAILTTEQNPKPKILERLESQWRSKFGGVQNARKVAILTGGLKFDASLKQTIKEMDFLNLRKFSRDELFATFQVSKTIVGISEDVNLANAKAAKSVWIENTIKPKMSRLVAFLNEFFANEWGDEYYFGYKDPSPENVDMNLTILEKASSILTINERRDLLEYEPIEGGDVLYVPNAPADNQGEDDNKDDKNKKYLKLKVNRKVKGIDYKVVVNHKTTTADKLKRLIKAELKKDGKVQKALKDMIYLTMTSSSKFGKKKKTVKKKEDESPIEITREKAEAFWKQMIARSEPQEISMKKKLDKFFKRQKEIVFGNLENNKSYKKDIDNYIFSVDEEVNVLMELMKPLLEKIMAQAGKDALELLGLSEAFEFTDSANAAIDKYNLLLSQSINTTTYEALREAIQAGITAGESNSKIKKRVTEIYEGIVNTRAETIVRTETIRANNLGNLEGYKQSGLVEFKEWLVALDEQTCEFCLQMEKKYKIVGINDNFLEKGSELEGIDGGIMKINYSDLLVPPLHPHCRCTIIPVVKVE